MNIKTLNIVSLDDDLIIKKGGTSSNIEYLDVSGLEYKGQVILMSLLIKSNGMILPTSTLVEVAIGGSDALKSIVSSLNQVAIDGTLEINQGDGNVPIESLIDDYANIPRITKEQFYNIE